MTTLHVPSIAQSSELLSYATPAGKARQYGSMGIVSVILGVVFIGLIGLLMIESPFVGELYSSVRHGDDLTTSNTLFCLGLATMMLGNVTLVRAGISAIMSSARAALAHRVYARLQFYGTLACLTAILWLKMMRSAHAAEPFYTRWISLLDFQFIGLLVACLLYPVLVMCMPIFKRIKTLA